MVECTALEMRHARKGIGGSNPSLSAIESPQLKVPSAARSTLDRALAHARIGIHDVSGDDPGIDEIDHLKRFGRIRVASISREQTPPTEGEPGDRVAVVQVGDFGGWPPCSSAPLCRSGRCNSRRCRSGPPQAGQALRSPVGPIAAAGTGPGPGIPDQITARTRAGPPVPPRCFGAPTKMVAPVAGSSSRLFSPSMPYRPPGSQE